MILSTIGDAKYRGGYHDAHGDTISTVGMLSTVGEIFCYLSTPQY